MATGLQIITSVSSSPLNDQEAGHEFTRWSINDLMDYLNQGLAEINNYRPDAFMDTFDVSLVVGSRQLLPVGYRLLKSVDAMSLDSVYSSGSPITQCDLELARTFYKAPCSPTGGQNYFRIINYAYDVKNPHVYYVIPPVPVGIYPPIKVTATMVLEPITYAAVDTIRISDIYLTILKFFIAAKALEVDTESTTSQGESDKLYKKFYNALGVKYSQETKYNSGMFAGQGGSNQMTKARQP